jgi:hypothetical protein
MTKIDYKKKLKHLYHSSAKTAEIVNVSPLTFLMLDGAGDPNTSPDFQHAVEVLFGLSYTLKFLIKKGDLAVDYGVMPLEGLWWTDDMSQFDITKKDTWKWTLMIMQPEYVTTELFGQAAEQMKKKKDPAALSKVKFASFHEGQAAQIMHLGPFSAEGPTIAKLHEFIRQNGFTIAGKHHEIYLSDIRKAAPEKWKTIIRQPLT